MNSLPSLSSTHCFKSLSKPSKTSLHLCAGVFIAASLPFFFPNIFHLGSGSYAVGTALCTIAIILVIPLAVRYAKTKKKTVLKNGSILVTNPMPPIQSVIFTDQSENAKREKPIATSLSFKSLPELAGTRILDFMELQDVLNFSTVNHHWKQLAKKAIAVFDMCRKYFIPIDKHESTKEAFNKFKKAQSFTQSVREQVYNDKEKTFNFIQTICFKDDKAYLNNRLTNHVEVWDSELKENRYDIAVSRYFSFFNIMLVGNVMHCYVDPFRDSQLKLFSFNIKTHLVLASGTFLLNEYGNCYGEMVFSFSEDKAFASKKDGSIIVWNLKQSLEIYNDDKAGTLLIGHKDKIAQLVYYNDLLYSSAEDDKIKIWNVNTSTCLLTIDTEPGKKFTVMNDLVVNSSYICRRFFKFPDTTTFKIWDQETGKCVQELKLTPWIYHYCMHENLLIFYVDNEIRILDLNCGQILRTIKLKNIDTPFINLQVANDKLVALFKFFTVSHVFTFDFTASKLSNTKVSDSMKELDSIKLS